MKKGFTLIEIMAVITILGILSTVAVVAVDKSIKNSKNALYDAQISTISSSAKEWAVDNLYVLPEENGNSCYITLKNLQDGAYIDENFENPKTGDAFSDDKTFIVIKNIYGNYEYETIVSNNYLTEDYGEDGLDQNIGHCNN